MRRLKYVYAEYKPICTVNGQWLSVTSNYGFINWKRLSPCLWVKNTFINSNCEKNLHFFLKSLKSCFFNHCLCIDTNKKKITNLSPLFLKHRQITMWVRVFKGNRVQQITEECLWYTQPFSSGITYLRLVLRILWYVAVIGSVADYQRFGLSVFYYVGTTFRAHMWELCPTRRSPPSRYSVAWKKT